MNFLKKIKDLNRKRLSIRKKEKSQQLDPRLLDLIRQARFELSEFDPAAHGNYPEDVFFVRPKSEFAPLHPAMDDFSRLIRECGGAKVLIFAPWISRGGADKVTITFFKVAQKKYGLNSVKIVLTEMNPIKTGLPKEIIDNTVLLSVNNNRHNNEILIDLVTRLVHFLAPEHCININSKTFWDALLTNGSVLSLNRKISVAAFCTEVLQDGRESGYAYSHLRDCARYVDHIISDNESFGMRLSNEGVLSKSSFEKWHVIRQPAEFDFSLSMTSINCVHAGPKIRSSVIWASRICYQKNWRVLINVARNNADVDFDVWGDGSDLGEFKISIAGIKNISYKGSFDSIAKIINEGNYDAFLYTSKMDGVPNILLEVGALGLPIISSSAGSILDLLSENNAFLVLDGSDDECYSRMLNTLLLDRNAAKDKAARLLEFIKEYHNIAQAEKSILEVI